MKFILTIIIAIQVVCIGCSSDKHNPNSEHLLEGSSNLNKQQVLLKGTDTDGGGDLGLGRPITLTEAVDLIHLAHKTLKLYVKYQDLEFAYSRRWGAEQDEKFKAIKFKISHREFNGLGFSELLSQSDEKDLLILSDKLCEIHLDGQATAKDATMVNGQICISAYGLTKKIRAFDIYEDGFCYGCPTQSEFRKKTTFVGGLTGNAMVDVLSLLLHEYSHLFGTTEEEALQLQTAFNYELYGLSVEEVMRILSYASDQAGFMTALSYRYWLEYISRVKNGTQFPDPAESEFEPDRSGLAFIKNEYARQYSYLGPLHDFLANYSSERRRYFIPLKPDFESCFEANELFEELLKIGKSEPISTLNALEEKIISNINICEDFKNVIHKELAPIRKIYYKYN